MAKRTDHPTIRYGGGRGAALCRAFQRVAGCIVPWSCLEELDASSVLTMQHPLIDACSWQPGGVSAFIGRSNPKLHGWGG